MSYISVILLAFALSVDAATVSFSYGLILKNMRNKNAFLLALFTGFFQAIMPVIGYFLTSAVKQYIMPYGKFIIFVIFIYLGIKIITDAFREKPNRITCLDIKCLICIGIATSIDAFSAGISLSLYGNNILKPAALIGFVTFINSLLGFFAGVKLQQLPAKFIEISAGLLLILLGLKALL